jgi:hypothetical protein
MPYFPLECNPENAYQWNMTIEQVQDMLRSECDKAGGQKAWGDARGISAQYVSDVIAGRRLPGSKVLAALGVERVVSYRRVRGGTDV